MTEADLLLATKVALDAAHAIVDVRVSARMRHDTKHDDSPVTAADFAADRTIREGLSVTGDVIVTEETWTGELLPTRGRVWVVDPLDGTRDFVAGSPDYVVQIALVIDGVPRVGVVCQPATMRMWRGIVGDQHSAQRSRCERIEPDGSIFARALSTADDVPAHPRLVVSVSHPSPGIDALAAAVGATVIPRGSVGLKIAALVDGEADAYVTDSRHIKVWDTAAPAAVLVAAGGSMTSLGGTELRYDGPIIHDDGVLALTASAANRWRAQLVRQR